MVSTTAISYPHHCKQASGSIYYKRASATLAWPHLPASSHRSLNQAEQADLCTTPPDASSSLCILPHGIAYFLPSIRPCAYRRTADTLHRLSVLINAPRACAQLVDFSRCPRRGVPLAPVILTRPRPLPICLTRQSMGAVATPGRLMSGESFSLNGLPRGDGHARVMHVATTPKHVASHLAQPDLFPPRRAFTPCNVGARWPSAR